MTGYNSQHDVLFIHVPKTAGTSMEQTEFVSGDGHKPYWAVPEEVRKRVGFSFGFVRNPYDRFVSIVTEGMYYKLRKAGRLPKTDAERRDLALKTRDLVTYAAQQGDQQGPLELGNTREWRIVGGGYDPLPHLVGWDYSVHYVPQVYFLSLPEMAGVGVDMVGRFENLAPDWRRVCERVGVDCELPHRRNTRSDRGHSYPDFYTPESMGIVRKLYARDFEVFGYDPDGMTPGTG